MIVLSGAELVLPDRVLTSGTLVIDGNRIVDIRVGGAAPGRMGSPFAFHGHYIVPGFIDVHVHGVDGVDTLDGGDAVATIAGRLPRYGVTAFCPTTVACPPDALRDVLQQVRHGRKAPLPRTARVLPAHLESNFINPEFRGAQPLGCLRSPRAAVNPAPRVPHPVRDADDRFHAAEILAEIERAAPDVGIVTLASEIEGGLDLIAWMSSRGHRVSLGHSGASYEEGVAAIAAGARQATHLFNRMRPFTHRAPGLVGAVLESQEVAAELICDGFHLHPATIRAAVAAKGTSRIMAVTDASAAAGLPVGATASLGGQPITAGDSAAYLAEDRTVAGSIVTMDRVFQMLVGTVGLSLVDAVTICSTTPARELGLVGHGVLATQAMADVVVLDANLSVIQTYVGGELAYSRAVRNPAARSL